MHSEDYELISFKLVLTKWQGIDLRSPPLPFLFFQFYPQCLLLSKRFHHKATKAVLNRERERERERGGVGRERGGGGGERERVYSQISLKTNPSSPFNLYLLTAVYQRLPTRNEEVLLCGTCRALMAATLH